MADVTARPRTASRSPIETGVDRIWRFFCSVRVAVWEIIILALLVLIGTLRGSSVPRSIADAVPVTEPVVARWYAWDVFHSLPFMGLLTLLAVAITICTLNRAPSIWRTIAHPTVTTTQGFLNSAGTAATFQAPTTSGDLTGRLTETLHARRYRVLTEQRGEETHFYADKHRYAKLGTFPFHLALILILIGGIVGARFGFRETEFVVPEGSVREVGRGTGLSVEVTRFVDAYSQIGIPIDYRSDLVIYENGEPVKEGSITVNNPLTYQTTTFYQTSFGQAVELRVTDQAGNLIYADSTDLGIFVLTENLDAPAGVLDLPPAGVRLHVVAPDIDPVNDPELDTLRLRPGEMYIQARPLSGAVPPGGFPAATVRQGETVALGELDVQFVRERRFTLMQVAYNPGIPIFFAAAFLLVGGLGVTFYFPHRRVRGIIRPAGGGSEAQLAPLARRDWSGQQEFRRLLEAAEERVGSAPVVRRRGEDAAAAGDG